MLNRQGVSASINSSNLTGVGEALTIAAGEVIMLRVTR
jgi:hypothetical protein